VATQAARGKTRLVFGVCSRARVYIDAQRRNPSNMGHIHIARPSQLQQPTIRERPKPASCDASVKDSVKRLVFVCCKKISSAPRLDSTNRGARACHDVSRRDERARRRSARVALLFSLTYQVVQLPILYVGLHLSQLSM
jgi:hypothetical protein